MPAQLRDVLRPPARQPTSPPEPTTRPPTLASAEATPWPRGVPPVTPGQCAPDVQHAVLETLLALGNRQTPVVLAGRVGVGKSTVAALVARSFSSWAWFGCDELLTTLMDCRREGGVQRWDAQGYATHTTEQQLLRRIEQCGVLVLDDVGTRQLSEAQTEALRAVLDARVRRPVIVTTNCDSQQLIESVGARNRSRLLAGAVVKIAGSDRRQEMALAPPPTPPGTPLKMGGTDPPSSYI